MADPGAVSFTAPNRSPALWLSTAGLRRRAHHVLKRSKGLIERGRVEQEASASVSLGTREVVSTASRLPEMTTYHLAFNGPLEHRPSLGCPIGRHIKCAVLTSQVLLRQVFSRQDLITPGLTYYAGPHYVGFCRVGSLFISSSTSPPLFIASVLPYFDISIPNPSILLHSS